LYNENTEVKRYDRENGALHNQDTGETNYIRICVINYGADPCSLVSKQRHVYGHDLYIVCSFYILIEQTGEKNQR
jgi:hypothetical protein